VKSFALAVLVLAACCGRAKGIAEPVPLPEKTLQVNKAGEPVDVDALLVPGFVVVVDFWGEHCGACKVVGGMLAVGVAQQDRVLIRKIDVGDGFTQVAKDHALALRARRQRLHEGLRHRTRARRGVARNRPLTPTLAPSPGEGAT
jgi:thiol-disulfide isomerase/thioredoxin